METRQEIQVVVRSIKHEDCTIKCDCSCNIAALKNIIKEKHVAKPEANQQRLIYAGRQLQDKEVLSSVFKNTEDPVVVHIVVSSSNSTSSTPTSIEPQSTLRHRLNAAPSSTAGTSPPSNNPTTTNTTTQLPTPQQTYEAYMQSMGQFPSAAQHQNIFAFHQQQQMEYIRQCQEYYANYMRYMAANHPTSTLPSYYNQQQPAAQMAQPPAQPPQAAPIAPQAAPNVRQPANQPPVVPAGGGGAFAAAADDDELQEQDWLDICFMLFRVFFVFGLIFFYSTLQRFFIIFFCSAFLYLYNRGFFTAQRRIPPPPRRRREQEAAAANGDNNANADGNNDATNEAANSDGPPSNDNDEVVPPPPPSRLSVIWCFITTFFTSLIPQAQPAAIR